MENTLLNNIDENSQNSLLEEYSKNVYEPVYDGDNSLLNSFSEAGQELEKMKQISDNNEGLNVFKHEKLTHEEQARIVFENYIRNTNRFLSGKEKRRLLRECIRNAKKGRYEYMFDEEKIAKKRERTAKAFEKMNSSNVSTKN